MKMAGRKTSAAYELYGFIPQVDNGKHSAICTSCNRVLQNTAAIRLQKHRNSCVAARASGESVPFPNLEIKKHVSSKVEFNQQNDSVNCSVKTEQSNMEFEDSNINDNNNHYEDTVEVKPNKRKRSRLATTTQTEKRKILHTVRKKPAEPTNTNSEHDENPILSPVTDPTQQTEPFESYQTTANRNSVLDINEDIEEVNDEDLINIQDELDVLQNLMPCSKVSRQLQEDLSKAETEYYRCKAAYFTKLTENIKVKRTVMLLESRKIQLEIEKLTNGS
ncbi:hypothetical protein DOY81_000846 [Sarcophaga bullata]|nr:hypothetical protein DOY81_000846 [Sarcophaga bullata]